MWGKRLVSDWGHPINTAPPLTHKNHKFIYYPPHTCRLTVVVYVYVYMYMRVKRNNQVQLYMYVDTLRVMSKPKAERVLRNWSISLDKQTRGYIQIPRQDRPNYALMNIISGVFDMLQLARQLLQS